MPVPQTCFQTARLVDLHSPLSQPGPHQRTHTSPQSTDRLLEPSGSVHRKCFRQVVEKVCRVFTGLPAASCNESLQIGRSLDWRPLARGGKGSVAVIDHLTTRHGAVEQVHRTQGIDQSETPRLSQRPSAVPFTGRAESASACEI